MSVRSEDHGASAAARGAPRTRSDGGPGLAPHHIFPIAVPYGWPEAVTYRAGARLFELEEDTVPELIRLGGDITAYLTEGEIAAMLTLTREAFERWLHLGWERAAEAEEV